ncbi:dihydropteroate synthase [Lutibacter sp.]|uniref:dihydropteroate synthase n=1 Tax=Lutibacter sp. TaxID=1925666 RepID=UPI002735EDB0|nr:dihydropteroate synthase [Lutibacter sp.]MDP3314417.1 dihydropteroate synthase [Lutibacter sp.]
MSSINCRGTLIDLTIPKVMGILNVTPDSFYDGGNYTNEKEIIAQVEKMLSEGATFIDVGAYSSQPNGTHISEDEELARISPILKLLISEFPAIVISVDTFRSDIAKKCVHLGASIINDISAGEMDEEMFNTVAELQVPYIAMHMKGTPQTMQKTVEYKNVVTEIISFFAKKISQLHELGVNDVIIDVGFGFGKNIEHNYNLLHNLSLFKSLEAPILTGISRKSMLYNPLNLIPDTALNATTVANTIALLNGTSILRVHDVKEAIEAIKIVELMKTSQ